MCLTTPKTGPMNYAKLLTLLAFVACLFGCGAQAVVEVGREFEGECGHGVPRWADVALAGEVVRVAPGLKSRWKADPLRRVPPRSRPLPAERALRRLRVHEAA